MPNRSRLESGLAPVGDSKCSARGLEAYAHAMPREESDLSFAEFGGEAKRRHTALEIESEIGESTNYLDSMARREGFASERSSR